MNDIVDLLIEVFFLTGLHNLCHPTIRDGSTWSKFGARGEHGDVFLFSNLEDMVVGGVSTGHLLRDTADVQWQLVF